jgi:hypothetical protein
MTARTAPILILNDVSFSLGRDRVPTRRGARKGRDSRPEIVVVLMLTAAT